MIIKLNVGGTKYETSKQTLTKYPDSMLARMFNGSLPSEQDKNGCYFIDADGEMFKYVLSYLRTGRLLAPKDCWERLEVEADFYQLSTLTQEIKEFEDGAKKGTKKVMNSDKIIVIDYTLYQGTYNQLKTKILSNRSGEFKVIGTSSREDVAKHLKDRNYKSLYYAENVTDLDEYLFLHFDNFDFEQFCHGKVDSYQVFERM